MDQNNQTETVHIPSYNLIIIMIHFNKRIIIWCYFSIPKSHALPVIQNDSKRSIALDVLNKEKRLLAENYLFWQLLSDRCGYKPLSFAQPNQYLKISQRAADSSGSERVWLHLLSARQRYGLQKSWNIRRVFQAISVIRRAADVQLSKPSECVLIRQSLQPHLRCLQLY